MRKISLIERVRRFGQAGIDVLSVFGRSAIFLFHALLGRGGIGGGFGLLVKQLHSVGVMSLVIIVVSGVFIGMVLALQGFNILSSYGSEQAVGQMVALTLLREEAGSHFDPNLVACLEEIMDVVAKIYERFPDAEPEQPSRDAVS